MKEKNEANLRIYIENLRSRSKLYEFLSNQFEIRATRLEEGLEYKKFYRNNKIGFLWKK